MWPGHNNQKPTGLAKRDADHSAYPVRGSGLVQRRFAATAGRLAAKGRKSHPFASLYARSSNPPSPTVSQPSQPRRRQELIVPIQIHAVYVRPFPEDCLPQRCSSSRNCYSYILRRYYTCTSLVWPDFAALWRALMTSSISVSCALEP